ncbi:MAG TPA: malectin domain-containing carbohydrate-binding protein, partial [Flavisolibacter sp.]|nr:malectin domain-containing carbohydrate-binding protein [Flavisolibacter sp.]
GEGFREMDRVGPINYKGLLTPWGEPLDAYYMFRANYAPKDKEPMVYIVSHTWPDRWITTGKKDSIVVYSNCDEVELFNDAGTSSLGKRVRNGIGTHFQWDGVDIQYNVLYAVGKVDGKVVARDYIVLNHLPQAPHFGKLVKNTRLITAPERGYHYLYRVNCGGPEYKDRQGNIWMADRKRKNEQSWGSLSWTDEFPGMPYYYASQRRTYDLIEGTADGEIFQDFRYGTNKLKYYFPLPDGDYRVELYFTEPWYGIGGGMDCSGWRVFDVAVNGKTVIKDLDIWKESGHDHALKKSVNVHISGGHLEISFPRVSSGQVVISAIAVATKKSEVVPSSPSPLLIKDLTVSDRTETNNWSSQTWLTTGVRQYTGYETSFSALPPELYGAEWIRTPYENSKKQSDTLARFKLSDSSDVFIALDSRITTRPEWLNVYADTKKTVQTDSKGGQRFVILQKRFAKGATVYLGNNGALAAGSPDMYTVFVLPVTHMEPAFDLKPSVKYEAEDANLKGAVVAKELYGGKKYVEYNGSNDQIEWSVTVGVGDVYALHINYKNGTGKTVPMNLKIQSSDGMLIKEGRLEFPVTQQGKWGTLDTSTETMINAGTYKILLSPAGNEKIGVDGLSVQ